MTQVAAEKNYDLSHEEIDRVFNTIEIPICPGIVSLVMSEAQKDHPDIKKLAGAIAKDVGMSALTIKLANSPLFRTSQAVSDVPTALARLGIRNVVCVVVGAAIRASITGLSAIWLEKFWNRAYTVATAAGLIARKQHCVAPDLAYTYALFHDAAIPLLMRRFENYADVMRKAKQDGIPLYAAESEYFPCTHPIIGSLLVRNWGLPAILGQAIRFHHEVDLYELPEQTLQAVALSLISVTHVAERITTAIPEEMNLEVSDEHFAHALNHLGLTNEDLAEINELLDEGGL